MYTDVDALKGGFPQGTQMITDGFFVGDFTFYVRSNQYVVRLGDCVRLSWLAILVQLQLC